MPLNQESPVSAMTALSDGQHLLDAVEELACGQQCVATIRRRCDVLADAVERTPTRRR